MNDAFEFRRNVEQPRASSQGYDPVSYSSFEHAACDPDATIVISSDWGLTIYLTVPAHLVRCDARTLWLLLSDLDAIYWMLGDTEIATVSLIRLPVGSAVNKPHHSVVVVNGVWTDENFAAEIRRQSAEVVLGARSRIDLTLLRAERDREIARRKTLRSTGPFALAWDFDVFPPRYPFKPFEWYEGDRD